MFEKDSVNKFDKNDFLVKKLQTSKETYRKSRDQSRATKTCCAAALVSSGLKRTMHLLHISCMRQLTRLVVLVLSKRTLLLLYT